MWFSGTPALSNKRVSRCLATNKITISNHRASASFILYDRKVILNERLIIYILDNYIFLNFRLLI